MEEYDEEELDSRAPKRMAAEYENTSQLAQSCGAWLFYEETKESHRRKRLSLKASWTASWIEKDSGTAVDVSRIGVA